MKYKKMRIINIVNTTRDEMIVKIYKGVDNCIIANVANCQFKIWLRLDNTFTEILAASIWRSQWQSEMF